MSIECSRIAMNIDSVKHVTRRAKMSDIIVTRHAHSRFMERFRLYFASSMVTSKRMWNSVIAEKVKGGRICERWDQCPFWVNKVFSEYGKCVIVNNGPCFFICKVKNNSKVVVVTVVPRWYNERPSIPKRKP